MPASLHAPLANRLTAFAFALASPYNMCLSIIISGLRTCAHIREGSKTDCENTKHVRVLSAAKTSED
eukprot:9279501-Alexandrium_andersonii.AAC.1